MDLFRYEDMTHSSMDFEVSKILIAYLLHQYDSICLSYMLKHEVSKILIAYLLHQYDSI